MHSIENTPPEIKETNRLFPVFLKLENLKLLIVGGGHVGLEKLTTVLQNAPGTNIRLVAKDISKEIKLMAGDYDNVTLSEKPYDSSDLDSADIVIAAVNESVLSSTIRQNAKSKGKLINVADTPDQCDFYLGSIVQKGNLKMAISTNGKSPTIAKRLKETFAELLPEQLDDVLDNMQDIRRQLNGDFSEKVARLNDMTKLLASKQLVLEDEIIPDQKKWPRIVKWCLLAFVFMILGHGLFTYFPLSTIFEALKTIPEIIDTKMFLMMLLCGFLAQMVDGSLGMGYGTISTTFLLAMGTPPAIVSSRVHSARVFSSGVSGYSHHRFGNINKKMFRALVIPGILGAIAGASMAFLSQKHPVYSLWVRLFLTFYTSYLGYFIIRKAFAKKKLQDKVKRAGWLASLGGFLDAFAGGGWGALVTSTLISKRKNPRYVIGSVCLAEFFVVLASAITFFILLESLAFVEILGLIIGGILAAPIAARLVGKLPLKTMYLGVGSVVILTSIITFTKVIAKLFS